MQSDSGRALPSCSSSRSYLSDTSTSATAAQTPNPPSYPLSRLCTALSFSWESHLQGSAPRTTEPAASSSHSLETTKHPGGHRFDPATDRSCGWAAIAGCELRESGRMFPQHSTKSLLSLGPEHQVLASASGRITDQKSQHFSLLQPNNMWLANGREKCTRTWATQQPVTAQPLTAMPMSPSPFRVPAGFPRCPEELHKVAAERWTDTESATRSVKSQSWGTKGEPLTQTHTFVPLWLPTGDTGGQTL